MRHLEGVSRRVARWVPSREQMAEWPSVSGNAVNGVGEAEARRPSPVYWHPPETIPHGPLQRWFYARTTVDEAVNAARRERQVAIDAQVKLMRSIDDGIIGALAELAVHLDEVIARGLHLIDDGHSFLSCCNYPHKGISGR